MISGEISFQSLILMDYQATQVDETGTLIGRLSLLFLGLHSSGRWAFSPFLPSAQNHEAHISKFGNILSTPDFIHDVPPIQERNG